MSKIYEWIICTYTEKVNMCYRNIKKRYVICHEKIVTVSASFFTSLGKSHTQKLFDFSAALHSACTQPEQRPYLNHNIFVSPKFPAKHTRLIWFVEHMRSRSRFQVVQFIIVAHLRQIFITFIITITCQNNFKQIWKVKKAYGLGRTLPLYLASNS
jgi:hypothetical protein